ncbi:MAG TPA: glycosyltransferase family 4 protein [Bacteroidales bacterium]|nr:glycosyltransferase family 4 protein [Bacteroidales bacterium]
MKVLMFGWEFPPHISGGLGTACYGLTKAILKQGVEIIFVVPRAFGDEDAGKIRLVNASEVPVDFTDEIFREHIAKISYLEVDSILVPYASEEEFYFLTEQIDKGVKPEQITSRIQKFSFSGGYGKYLMEEVKRYAFVGTEIARKFDFDVIHAHDWLTYMAGIEAKRISRKPLVVHMHATEFDRSGENVNQQVYDIERAGMEAADRVISVSNLTRNIVIARYGINPEKVVTVHNAVEPLHPASMFDTSKNVDEKIVTFLGRITFQKGPEYFIEAANKVLKRDPNVRFVMAGSGDMMHNMVRRVARLGISTRFHFTGFLRGEDVDRMFGMSDVYVMPSVSEPFGISPLEAMMSNVPVIISKQSGVAEILNYVIKVDFWDIDAMADAIYGLLHYNSLPEMFRKHGKAEVESIKWDHAGKKVIEIYQSLLPSG